MKLGPDQRRLLGDFLRRHREALSQTPEASTDTRRRTPGLRREDVAQLCGMSTTWYTWAEQGRDIALSAAALARLSTALRLNPAERDYLFELARKKDPSPPAIAQEAELSAALFALLDMTPTPAYLLDRLWNAIAWNAAAARLFSPWFESGERNLLRYVFIESSARVFICDWEDRAHRLIAEFRSDTAQDPNDPMMSKMIRDLLDESDSFSAFWHAHIVLAREGGRRSFAHPQDGLVAFEQITLVPSAHPNHKLVILLPAEAP